MAGEIVPISGDGAADGFTFLGWIVLTLNGKVTSWNEQSQFVMPNHASTVAAVYGKVETWFPPGDEEAKTGLLLPIISEEPQQRSQQRIRVTFSLGDAAGRLKPHHLWSISRVLLDWFPKPEAQGTWGATEVVKCFDKEVMGEEIGRNQAIPKGGFVEVAQGVFEASVWHESIWTLQQVAEKAGQDKEKVHPALDLRVDLGVSTTPSFFISRMKNGGALLPAVITRIWSDQFETSETNQLPNEPEPSRIGSGRHKPGINKPEHILVGARNAQDVHMKAEVDFPDVPELRSSFKFALARMSDGVPLIKGPSSSVDEDGKLALETSEIDPVVIASYLDDYVIVGGYDADGNGLVDSEIRCIWDYTIHPVSSLTYNVNHAYLGAYVMGGYFFNYPIAAEFLRVFLTGANAPILGATLVQETLSIHDGIQPDYHVGIAFTSDDSGPVRKYIWGKNSVMADQIVHSAYVTDLIQKRLASDIVKHNVRHYSWKPDENQKTFAWTLSTLAADDVLLEFSGADADLQQSLGGTTLSQARLFVTVDRATLTATSVVVRGTVNDLYDFDYRSTWAEDRRAVTVQAGYNTLGSAGWIYRIQVNIDTEIQLPSPPYNFN